MEIYNNRVAHTSNSSLGILSFDKGNPWAFIIEDEPRDKKIMGETRIRSGRYKLGIRKEDTPLTINHRKSYGSWFKYHIEVLDVPNFTGIYFHAGNNESHTAGCQIGAKNVYIKDGEFTCVSSTPMIKQFYSIVYPKLLNGEDVYYNIIDEFNNIPVDTI